MELSDDVVRDAVAGEPLPLRRVYEALSPRVLAYLRSRGVEDPDGSTSEVFLALVPRLPALGGGVAGLRTLAFSIAHARVVDDARRRARRPHVLADEPDHDERTTESAEQRAVDTVEAERAMRLMHRLGEDQRAVVALRIVGDLTLQETAQVLGKTVPSVKQLQRRGLERLRGLMVTPEAPR